MSSTLAYTLVYRRIDVRLYAHTCSQTHVYMTFDAHLRAHAHAHVDTHVYTNLPAHMSATQDILQKIVCIRLALGGAGTRQCCT